MASPTVPTKRYPASLIASDLRMLIGMGFVAVDEPNRHYVGRGNRAVLPIVAAPGRIVSGVACRRAVFELAPLASSSTEREVYMVSLENHRIARIERLRDIAIVPPPRPPPITVRSGGPAVLAYSTTNEGAAEAYVSYRSRREAWLVRRRLRPLAEPLLCSVLLFERPEVEDDDSPVLVLNDENGDRAVLAVGNLAPPGYRIEAFPDAPIGHKPPWFSEMEPELSPAPQG